MASGHGYQYKAEGDVEAYDWPALDKAWHTNRAI